MYYNICRYIFSQTDPITVVRIGQPHLFFIFLTTMNAITNLNTDFDTEFGVGVESAQIKFANFLKN